jgi:hypothetical protein
MKRKSMVSDDLPTRFQRRTRFMNKRYVGHVTSSGIKVVRIVQSVTEDNVVLIHMMWTFGHQPVDFTGLGWITRELKNYFLVESSLRRVMY